MTANTSPIIAKVCKNATYSTSKDGREDLTSVKITNIHEDGGRSTTFMAIRNYAQPWALVKSERRKFEQHKDYIEMSQVREYKMPRCQIAQFAKKQLTGRIDYDASISEMSNSPYVFGLDQTPPVHIKYTFFKKYGEYQEKEPYTVASFDVEARMDVPGEQKPMMMGSLTMKDRAYLAAVRSWYKEDNGYQPTDAEIFEKLKTAELKYLGEHLNRRKATVQYELFDTPGQVAYACVMKFHEWEPDWIVSWNAEYDMKAVESALRTEGYNLEDVYNDPTIPKNFRFYKLDLGRTHKIKEDGSSSPLEPQEKWPTVRCMARWKWCDAMSFYCIKRQPSEGKLPDISLEGCAKHADVPGKLYTEEGAHLLPGSPQWHRYMQKKYKYLYSMYCIGDNFVIEEINDKTHDFTLSLPMLLKYSEFFNYASQPKLISDTMSFFAREHGFAWGSTPRRRDTTFTDQLPSLKNWIALLDTEKNAEVGYSMFVGLFDVISQGRRMNDDIDVEGAYPHGGLAANTSNRTTQIETVQIQGADPNKFREIGVNFASSAEANAMSLCSSLFGFPEADMLQEVFEKIMKEQGREEQLEEIKSKTNRRKKFNNEELFAAA